MRGASLARYGEVAEALGLDPRSMYRRNGIDPRALAEPELRIPADKVITLLEDSARASGCEAFGVLMAERRTISDYGPVSLLLAHQPSMRRVFETIVRYQRMLNQTLLVHLEDEPGQAVTVRLEIAVDGAGPMRQAYELGVGTHAMLCRVPRGPRWRPLSAHFTHGPPNDLAAHRRMFGCPLEFNSDFNGLVVSRIDIDAINPAADPALAEHAEQLVRTLPQAEEGPVSVEVERAIQVLLPVDGATIEGVAARLGVNRRTLQRRLADEGAEFSRLLNEIRRHQAVRYLANPRLPINQVAGLVGYNHETSFARWFASDFGVPPRTWRAERRGEALA